MNAITNPSANAISKIAYRIAGNCTKFYLLDTDARAEIRDLATQLYDAGQTVGLAEIFESTNRNGFVYVITNPAFPGAVKIGRACDPEARLNKYQTGDPYRKYELKFALYFEDCHLAESMIHTYLKAHQLEGEWFSVSTSFAIDTIKILDARLSLNLRLNGGW